jgi:hypothetical protein
MYREQCSMQSDILGDVKGGWASEERSQPLSVVSKMEIMRHTIEGIILITKRGEVESILRAKALGVTY